MDEWRSVWVVGRYRRVLDVDLLEELGELLVLVLSRPHLIAIPASHVFGGVYV